MAEGKGGGSVFGTSTGKVRELIQEIKKHEDAHQPFTESDANLRGEYRADGIDFAKELSAVAVIDVRGKKYLRTGTALARYGEEKCRAEILSWIAEQERLANEKNAKAKQESKRAWLAERKVLFAEPELVCPACKARVNIGATPAYLEGSLTSKKAQLDTFLGTATCSCGAVLGFGFFYSTYGTTYLRDKSLLDGINNHGIASYDALPNGANEYFTGIWYRLNPNAAKRKEAFKFR